MYAAPVSTAPREFQRAAVDIGLHQRYLWLHDPDTATFASQADGLAGRVHRQQSQAD